MKKISFRTKHLATLSLTKIISNFIIITLLILYYIIYLMARFSNLAFLFLLKCNNICKRFTKNYNKVIYIPKRREHYLLPIEDSVPNNVTFFHCFTIYKRVPVISIEMVQSSLRIVPAIHNCFKFHCF